MVYPRQLTIQLRKRQLLSIIPDPAGVYGYNIYYAGPNPLSLTQVYGTIDNPWNDYTEFVDGLDKLALTWSAVQSDNGQNEVGNFVPKKSASASLVFERDAYNFIQAWLVNDMSAPLNQIEVQITDTANGTYVGYMIKSTSLSWCEFDALCTYDLNIKQEDQYYQCMQRTMLADNWNGWFQPEPINKNGGLPTGTLEAPAVAGTPKFHPRFSYCTEHRPNATLVIEWYLMGLLGLFSSILVIIYSIIALIELIVNAVISAINTIVGWINDISGGHTLGTLAFLTILDPLTPLDSLSALFIEAAGCGREHASPLIRDYIMNTCNKCGISVTPDTADIFFAAMINIQKSDGLTYNEPNPHYNACLFYPTVVKGTRRYATINFFGTSPMDTTTFYDPNNQPMWALSDMLDALKKMYNMQWRILADDFGVPYLYIKRRDWFSINPPLYDFSSGGADRSKLIEGICYQPSDVTLPASMNGLYQDDPADKSGHEAGHWMNGNPLSFNNTLANPMFFGILDKTSGFGATKFRLDGAATDYVYDAGQVVMNSAAIQPWLYYIMLDVFDQIRQYGDYALLLGGETVSLPKILIWDGNPSDPDPTNRNTFLNARAVRDKVALAGAVHTVGKIPYPIPGPVPMPDINTKYPQQISPTDTITSLFLQPSVTNEPLAWNDPLANPPQTNVIGHDLSFSPPVPGFYTVQDYFGNVISQNPAFLVNYPMYFQPFYKDSMWDWFHWIDDPYANPKLHKDFNLKIPLCGPDLERLGLMGDGSRCQLLSTILLDTLPYSNAVITEITVSYDTGSADGTPGTGQFIEIKGIV